MSKNLRYALYVLFVCALLLFVGSATLRSNSQQDAATITAETRSVYGDAASETADTVSDNDQTQTSLSYVLNTNTMRFHLASCRDVPKIAAHNYATSSQPRDEIISRGYSPCGHCNP